MVHKTIRRWVRDRNYPSKSIAGHSLIPGGRIAGRIDEIVNGRLRGWIYDAANPNESLKLRLLIDGVEARLFLANIYREDIAALSGNHGLNGFDVELSIYLGRNKGSATVKIEIAGNRKYHLGPIVVIPNAMSSAHGVAEDGFSSAAVLDQKLQHVFDHITVTFEETRRHLEHLRSGVDMLGTGGALGVQGSGSSLIARSTISGVGAFRDDPSDDALERSVMAYRIESHLAALSLSS